MCPRAAVAWVAGGVQVAPQEKGGSVLVIEVYMQLGSDGTAGARPMEGSSSFPSKARMDQRLLMRSPVLAVSQLSTPCQRISQAAAAAAADPGRRLQAVL